MPSHGPRILPLLAAVLLLTGAAEPVDSRETLDLSEHGTVLGPMDRPAGEEEEAESFARFIEGMRFMGAGEYRAAADTFDALWRSTGWPEVAYNAALAWYAEGTFDVALRRAERATEALPDDVGAQYLHGVLLQAVGRHEDASQVLVATLGQARDGGRRYDESIGLLNLGTSARLLGRPDEALEYFAQARAIGEELGLTPVVAAAWMGEGQVHLGLGNRAMADVALGAARRLGRRVRFGAAEADADLSTAAVALAEGSVPRARQLLARALERIEQLDDRSVRGSMLLTAAELQFDLGDRPAAEASLDRAIELFEESGVDVGRAHALQTRGSWALDEGDLGAAERALQEAISIQERFQVPLAEADTRRHLAELRAAQGHLGEAMELVESSVAVFREAKALELERAALLAQASILSMAGQLDRATVAAERALELAAQVDDRSDQHRLRSEIVILTAARGDVDDALGMLREIPTPAFGRLGSRQRARVHLQLAWSLRNAGRHGDAVGRGRKALDAATQGRHPAEDLAEGAREIIVYALVEGGDADGAERFLAGLEGERTALQEYIKTKRAVDTYNDGIALLQEGQTAEAIDKFEQVRVDPETDDERRATAARTLQGALLQHGHELVSSQKLEEAEAALVRAEALADERKDAIGLATILALRADVRERVGDVAGSAELALRAADLAAGAGDVGLAGDCWMVAGQALFEDQPERARAAFTEALASWGDEPRTLGKRAVVTYNLAALDLQLEESGEALHRFREARRLATGAGDAGLVARIDEILVQLESE
jgi:tetratricopeptide (TPR) repeat protein